MDFIVVGGVAAILDGAPAQTIDLDIVHARDPENISRIAAALAELDAYYRFPAERRLRPNESHLAAPGHLLLATRFGMLDVLGTIGKGRRYSDLLPHAPMTEIAPGLSVRVLDLETVIATKEEAGREKDDHLLPLLRATLAEIRRAKS